MPVAWLAEPHAFKTAFFRAVAEAAGGGTRLATWPLSFRGFPESAARADDCLARAKKQPEGPLGTFLKRAFLRGRYNWARRWFAAHPGHVALCWQGLTGTRRAVMLGARDAGAATLFAELSPLPGYLTLDPKGVNAEGSVPQDPRFYDDVAPDAALLAGLRDRIRPRASRRADVGQGGAVPVDSGPFVFVPLQVPDDSQMLLFSGWVGGADGFIRALAAAAGALPDGWHLRLKEHPSSKIALTAEIDAAIAAGARIVLDNATDSFAQLSASGGVLTVNSSMGLQAMFWDKPVIVTGQSLYALPGVAHHAGDLTALKAALADLPRFDGPLRARFLTWLATAYYIPQGEDGPDRAALARRLAGLL